MRDRRVLWVVERKAPWMAAWEAAKPFYSRADAREWGANLAYMAKGSGSAFKYRVVKYVPETKEVEGE